MSNVFLRLGLPVMIMAAGLLSCSSGDGDRQDNENVARVFDAEDKRAAQALSVGSGTLLESAQTEYEQALLCKVAVDAIAPRLQAGLDTTQAEAVTAIQRALDERVRREVAAQGRNRYQIAADLGEREQAGEEVGMRARIAVACIREFA
jgi:hypothetical protein